MLTVCARKPRQEYAASGGDKSDKGDEGLDEQQRRTRARKEVTGLSPVFRGDVLIGISLTCRFSQYFTRCRGCQT